MEVGIELVLKFDLILNLSWILSLTLSPSLM